MTAINLDGVMDKRYADSGQGDKGFLGRSTFEVDGAHRKTMLERAAP